MRVISFLLAALGLPTLALAQTTPGAASRFYVGAGASLTNKSLFRDYDVLTSLGGVLTAGWQFSPRLAVQLSPALHSHSQQGSQLLYYQGANRPPTGTSSYHSCALEWSVPLLLRYTCTAPTRRLHLDVLAGVAWVRATVIETNSTVDNDGTVLSSGRYTIRPDDYAALQVGPALRYGLGPHLELAATLPLRYELRTHYTHWGPTPFSDRLSLQATLGVQYAL